MLSWGIPFRLNEVITPCGLSWMNCSIWGASEDAPRVVVDELFDLGSERRRCRHRGAPVSARARRSRRYGRGGGSCARQYTMADTRKRTVVDRRSRGLRQAASTVFMLTAILPLLILTWTLGRLRVLHTPEAQIGLAIALGVALLGLAVFRSLMARLSNLIVSLRMLVARREDTAPPTHKGQRIPVVGEIGEIGDVERTLAEKWRIEASAYLQRPVLVYVVNSWTPIVGTLVEVTEQGVLVKHEGQETAIGFRRFLGIRPAEA